MTKFLLFPNTNVTPDLTATNNSSCKEMIWENGSIIDPEEYNLSRLEFFCETLPSGEMTDYAVSDLGCSVVSGRFKDLLDSLGVDSIQYFEASIIEKDGAAAKTGYYAANIVGLIDCIDREEPDMRVKKNGNGDLIIIVRIDKLVLKDVCDYGIPLFRSAYFTRLILVNHDLKQKIEECSLKGVRFVLPDRWDGIYGER